MNIEQNTGDNILYQDLTFLMIAFDPDEDDTLLPRQFRPTTRGKTYIEKTEYLSGKILSRDVRSWCSKNAIFLNSSFLEVVQKATTSEGETQNPPLLHYYCIPIALESQTYQNIHKILNASLYSWYFTVILYIPEKNSFGSDYLTLAIEDNSATEVPRLDAPFIIIQIFILENPCKNGGTCKGTI